MLEDKLETLLRHVENVRENCELLAWKLIKEGESELGLQLIVNGKSHDNSKFSGIEWLYLHPDIKEKEPELFRTALLQHNKTNLHHPEAWAGGIEEMPRLYIAEMVCDWKSRSNEFGNDLIEWIKEEATDRFKFSTSGRVYKDIKFFVDKLLEKKFK